VEGYDDYVYSSKCKGLPNRCLFHFAKIGDIRNLKIAIKKGANGWNIGMYGATQEGHFDLVKFFVEKGASNYQPSIYIAKLDGYNDIVEYLTPKMVTKIEIKAQRCL
jgi:hypothetical protein